MTKHVRTLRAALILAIGVAAVARTGAMSDGDGDGIDDADEQAIAERFLPVIHYSYSESCANPGVQPVIFRARHPTWLGQPENQFMLIEYTQLYDQDCGPNGHNGDNESFQVWLQWNGADWQFYSLAATAHWGAAVCESHTFSFTDELWIGNDKHGTYADTGGSCGCAGSDNCSNPGWTKDHVLYNAGEPSAHLLDWLGTVEGYWNSEFVWSDNQFLDAGTIRDQLYNTNYAHVYQPPPAESQACYDQCWNNYVQCGQDPQECDLEYNTCNNDCYAYIYYWDA